MENTSLRSLPSVNKLLEMELALDYIGRYGRPLTLEAIREVLEEIRKRFVVDKQIPDANSLLTSVGKKLEYWAAPTLKPVINASGVIIHTNLGRSPLSKSALEAMAAVAAGYSTLEYDISRGTRGSRTLHAEALLQRLTGAEAVLVVNNNASAVLLALSALARRRRVVISRTQLIEIGGSFRIPDVMRQSGAKLVEVGATNRVHLGDYEQALLEQPVAVLLTAHWSNFRIVGFTSEPSTAELAVLAQQHNIPFVNDLGSGTLIETSKYGLMSEPTVPKVLADGVDLVTFSGDKLLGGPQAGIIAGRADLVAKLKKHPLARAVRADKLCLAALSATLTHYLKDEAEVAIPIWQMISASTEAIKTRAEKWTNHFQDLENVSVIPGESTVGGGSLPGETLPTYLLAIKVRSPKRFLEQLRGSTQPVIARVQDDNVVLDPRTVLLDQDGEVIETLISLLRYGR